MDKKKARQQAIAAHGITWLFIWGLVCSFGLTGVLAWAFVERGWRQVAENQVQEQWATIDRLIPAVIEWTAQPCAKVDMVDLGPKGWVIGGSHLPNINAEQVKRHVRKNEYPGLPTAYYYVDGPNSTPDSRLITKLLAKKPDCRSPTPLKDS